MRTMPWILSVIVPVICMGWYTWYTRKEDKPRQDNVLASTSLAHPFPDLFHNNDKHRPFPNYSSNSRPTSQLTPFREDQDNEHLYSSIYTNFSLFRGVSIQQYFSSPNNRDYIEISVDLLSTLTLVFTKVTTPAPVSSVHLSSLLSFIDSRLSWRILDCLLHMILRLLLYISLILMLLLALILMLFIVSISVLISTVFMMIELCRYSYSTRIL